MSASVVANTCRITVISASLRADLAVPVHIPVAELLATVVSSLGREVADEGAASGGWVLQRAAEPPLDPAMTLAASQIRDGDILHLRTRATQLPEVAFDDVLDAVATGVLTRTARWRPELTTAAAAVVACAALLVGLLAILATGPRWGVAAVAAGATALLLVLAALAVGRSYHRRGTALVAASAGIAYAAVAGACALGGDHSPSAFGAPQFLVAAAAAVLAATVAILTLGSGLPGFTAIVCAGLLTAAGTGVASGTSLSPAGTAALVAGAALACSPLLPMLSFTLARLPLPAIPSDAADLRRDTGRIDSAHILRQAGVADQFLTGLVAGTATAVAGSAMLLAGGDGSARALALVLAAICLLRARLFTGRGQRAMLLAAGVLGLGAVGIERLVTLHGTTRIIAVAVPAVVLGLLMFAAAVVLPERRHAPPWGRAADIVESLLVLSVIPLALAVMGVYGSIRVAVS